jgi:hypothetical protein
VLAGGRRLVRLSRSTLREIPARHGRAGRPAASPGRPPAPSFAQSIAAALSAEWGASPSARKEVGRITGANERAVRNWFEAKNSPSGENLVRLLAHSDAVLTTVLTLSGREELLANVNVKLLRDQLVKLLESVDESRSIPPD